MVHQVYNANIKIGQFTNIRPSTVRNQGVKFYSISINDFSSLEVAFSAICSAKIDRFIKYLLWMLQSRLTDAEITSAEVHAVPKVSYRWIRDAFLILFGFMKMVRGILYLLTCYTCQRPEYYLFCITILNGIRDWNNQSL